LPEDGVFPANPSRPKPLGNIQRSFATQRALAQYDKGLGFILKTESKFESSSAGDLALYHQLGIWDSVILSASAAAGCRLLLSEDLQDGFTWNGVTVANPFAEEKHHLVGSLLDS
jgi:predicted nucleic acid-binding protein